MNTDKNIKIVLVDDHQIVRDGIKSLLEGVYEIEILGEASNGKELFSILETIKPNIILLDISLPDMSGIEITKKLSETYPRINILILSMYTNEEFILNALKFGAKGYLPKNSTRDELIEAIFSVYQGKEYYSEEVSSIMLNSFIKKAKYPDEEVLKKEVKLSVRETEILRMCAEGSSNQEIASSLQISIRTVESHKNHIMQKLELRTIADMIKYAIKNNIIEI